MAALLLWYEQQQLHERGLSVYLSVCLTERGGWLAGALYIIHIIQGQWWGLITYPAWLSSQVSAAIMAFSRVIYYPDLSPGTLRPCIS